MKKIIESYNNSLRIASIIFLPGKTFLELYLEIIPERFSALLFK